MTCMCKVWDGRGGGLLFKESSKWVRCNTIGSKEPISTETVLAVAGLQSLSMTDKSPV